MPEQDAIRQWMIHDNGQQYGPYLKSEITPMLVDGRISRSAQAWREGIPAWVPLTTIIPPQIGTPAPVNIPPQVYPNVPPPAGMDRCWMVHDRGHQFGPHTEAELATLVAMGTISTTAMIWRNGLPQWLPISSALPTPAPSPQSMPNNPAPTSQLAASQPSNRIAAGVCGILLGCFGVHKFILGFTQAGVIMLGVTIVGAWLFGLGPMVMGVFGLIEGIIYLTKTDAQFHQEYVIGKKQWF